MSYPPGPPEGSEEFRWWLQGARDEADARQSGLSVAAISLLNTVEALAQLWPDDDEEQIATRLASIYCPRKLRMRYRH